MSQLRAKTAVSEFNFKFSFKTAFFQQISVGSFISDKTAKIDTQASSDEYLDDFSFHEINRWFGWIENYIQPL